MPLIIPANTLASGGYAVENSLRFNRGSSDGLSKTFGTNSNRRTFTISSWCKFTPSSSSGARVLFGASDGTGYLWFLYNSNATLYIQNNVGGGVNSLELSTTQVFRDFSAWYHIVFAVDTTQATSSDRAKFYINGNQVTAFSASTYPSLNADLSFTTSTQPLKIGEIFSDNYFDGYMSEINWIDGQALTPDNFGEFDEDSGIWKPIDVSGLTFGTNGFYLDFEDSAALGADVSGNTNNFTVNNLTAVDQTTDTPTNNFATLNPLNNNTSATSTFSEGNLKLATDGNGGSRSSIAVSSGKWYCEVKCVSNTAWNGVTDVNQYINNEYTTNSVALYVAGATLYVGGVNQGSGGYGSAWTSNDIMNLALDLDSGTKKLYFGKNGGWWNGSTYGASSPSTGVTLTNDVTYAITVGSGSGTSTNEANFGNPAFTISSGNTDGNDRGNFEYAPPSGYLSLCTANLSEVLG